MQPTTITLILAAMAGSVSAFTPTRIPPLGCAMVDGYCDQESNTIIRPFPAATVKATIQERGNNPLDDMADAVEDMGEAVESGMHDIGEAIVSIATATATSTSAPTMQRRGEDPYDHVRDDVKDVIASGIDAIASKAVYGSTSFVTVTRTDSLST